MQLSAAAARRTRSAAVTTVQIAESVALHAPQPISPAASSIIALNLADVSNVRPDSESR